MTAEPGDLFIEHTGSSLVMRFLLFLIDVALDEDDRHAESYAFAYIVLDTNNDFYEVVNDSASKTTTRILFDTPKHSVSEI
jgi:hypothetical protein